MRAGLAVMLATASESIESAKGQSGDGMQCASVASSMQVDDSNEPWVYWLIIGLIVGWMFGVGCAFLWSCRCRQRREGDIHVQVSARVSTGSPPEAPLDRAPGETQPVPVPESGMRLPRAPRNPRGRRQRIYMYLPTNGECIHLAPTCSTLRGADVQERSVCQRCPYYELHLR